MDTTTPTETKILVTGFGPFQDIASNPSFSITFSLPSSLPSGSSLPSHPNITILTHPDPLKATYHTLLPLPTHLISTYTPDIILHIGLATEQSYFSLERSASRDGYHSNLDMSRRVFTRAENKKVWGKRPESLASTLDLDGVLEVWKEGVKNVVVGGKRGKGGKGKEKEKGGNVNLSVTDDVGNYVCGFLYYASLLEMGKREDGRRNVVFLHVPLLETEEELEKGRLVVMALITALAEVNGRVGD